MLKKFASVALVMAFVLGLASLPAMAFSLNGGSQSLNGDATIDGDDPDPEPALGSGGNDVVHDSGSDYWEWGDHLGDDSNVAVTDAGLALGTDQLSRTDGTGASTGGHDPDGQGGAIKLDLDGGDVTGDSGATNLYTNYDPPIAHNNPLVGGPIIIANVGTVGMGTISTKATRWDAGWHPRVRSGYVQIGTDSAPATGEVRVMGIDTCNNSSNHQPGAVYIYGGGDVLVSDGGVTPTYGNIDTSSYRPKLNTDLGKVEVYHNGTFAGSQILTNSSGYGGADGRGGSVTLQGNWTPAGPTAPSGDCTVSEINTEYDDDGYTKGNGGDVDISGYQDVTIGTLNTRYNRHTGRTTSDYEDYYGGSVTIGGASGPPTVAGDISITGSINLEHTGYPVNNGDLTLRTSGGKIEMASLDMDTVGVARLDAAANSYLSGELSNLDLTSSGGTGSFSNPILLDQTALCLPAGQYLFYDYEAGVLNDPLAGWVYKLADMDQNPGQGGLLLTELQPIPEPGSLGLIGLALLGIRRRKRS
jgi:hypothetical protein